VLEAELTTAPQRVAAELEVEPHSQVVVRRVATAHTGATAAVLTSWFPASLAESAPDLLARVPARALDLLPAHPDSPRGQVGAGPTALRRGPAPDLLVTS
jgi:hypothetical protein